MLLLFWLCLYSSALCLNFSLTIEIKNYAEKFCDEFLFVYTYEDPVSKKILDFYVIPLGCKKTTKHKVELRKKYLTLLFKNKEYELNITSSGEISLRLGDKLEYPELEFENPPGLVSSYSKEVDKLDQFLKEELGIKPGSLRFYYSDSMLLKKIKNFVSRNRESSHYADIKYKAYLDGWSLSRKKELWDFVIKEEFGSPYLPSFCEFAYQLVKIEFFNYATTLMKQGTLTRTPDNITNQIELMIKRRWQISDKEKYKVHFLMLLFAKFVYLENPSTFKEVGQVIAKNVIENCDKPGILNIAKNLLNFFERYEMTKLPPLDMISMTGQKLIKEGKPLISSKKGLTHIFFCSTRNSTCLQQLPVVKKLEKAGFNEILVLKHPEKSPYPSITTDWLSLAKFIVEYGITYETSIFISKDGNVIYKTNKSLISEDFLKWVGFLKD